MKLFGTKRSSSRLAGNRPAHMSASGISTAAKKRKGFPFKGVSIALAVVLVFEILYFVAVYSDNAFITKWRNIYINTALDTLNHKWLATAIIPPDVIDEVRQQRNQSLMEQEGMESNWNEDPGPIVPDPDPVPDDPGPVEPQPDDPPVTEDPTEPPVELPPTPDEEKKAFYELFYEVDPVTMEEYLEKNPDVLENGWSGITINEAGLDDKGTSIRTVYGEQVLAIDVPNKALIIRVEGSSYLGVLAIAKDPSKLSLRPSSKLGEAGETAGAIAKQYNGLISITASGFIDPNGVGNGGLLAGYAMCDGVEYGNHMGWGYKRLELRENNLMYILDVSSPVGEGTTDAVEFQPALIIDGRVVVDQNTIYSALSPRTCIGQSKKHEILMLVIEGRMPTRSLGTDVIECANILKRHDCMQAMNLDGGTSAMMWYDGEYIIKCSNAQLPQGRPLPTAFVYARSE